MSQLCLSSQQPHKSERRHASPWRSRRPSHPPPPRPVTRLFFSRPSGEGGGRGSLRCSLVCCFSRPLVYPLLSPAHAAAHAAARSLPQLEGLFVLLVAVMTVAFFVDFFISPPSATEVLEGFAFRAESYATVPALGLIGAVIMPHNIYLHSALVLSRLVDRSNSRKLWEVSRVGCTHE